MKLKPWQGIIISVLLGAISIYYLIYRNGMVNFGNINFLWLNFAIIMIILWWIANASSTKIISCTLGMDLRLIDSLKLVFAGFFSGAITTFSSGTIPGEIAFLLTTDVPPDYALELVSIRTIMNGISKGILALILASSMYSLIGSLIGRILLTLFLTYSLAVGGRYFIFFSRGIVVFPQINNYLYRRRKI